MSGTDIGHHVDSVTTHTLIERSGRAALKKQNENGSFPSSKNAHYEDTLTPVRTTSHWMLTMAKSHDITGEQKFLDSAKRAANYLLSTDCRPKNQTFYCRNGGNNDHCNGVVGQAIPIWSLSKVSNNIGCEKSRITAEQVANIHPFNSKVGLWNRREIDGTTLTFDRTLNHQIAFAAAVSGVCDSNHLKDFLNTFLNKLDDFMQLRKDGVIRHLVKTPVLRTVQSEYYYDALVSVLNRAMFELYRWSTATYKKEIGYQSVNLYWLSILKQNTEHHPIWDSKLINNCLNYIHSKEYLEELSSNSMAFVNTPTGFQNAVAINTLGSENTELMQAWIESQIEISYDINENSLGRGASAPELMASAICHLVDLPNIELFNRPKSGKDRLHELLG